jgi:hypothetical protein
MRTAVLLRGLLRSKPSSRHDWQFKKQLTLSLHQRRPVGLRLLQTVEQFLTVRRRHQIGLGAANGNN